MATTDVFEKRDGFSMTVESKSKFRKKYTDTFNG